jgi:hypothetical protein
MARIHEVRYQQEATEMEKKKAQHGGKREPGPGKKLGRPPTDGAAKETLAVRVGSDVKAFFEHTRDESGRSIGQQIEDTTRRTAAFKRWQKFLG